MIFSTMFVGSQQVQSETWATSEPSLQAQHFTLSSELHTAGAHLSYLDSEVFLCDDSRVPKAVLWYHCHGMVGRPGHHNHVGLVNKYCLTGIHWTYVYMCVECTCMCMCVCVFDCV